MIKVSAKVDSAKWKKQIDQLSPQLKAAAGKVIIKYGDQARAKLEQNIGDKTGGYKGTIKSGQGVTSQKFFYWLRFGDDNNPAGNYEWNHIDKKSGKLVRGARVFYPIVRVINKAMKAALRRANKSILKAIFKS
jgi:hypothetical protein